jgi:hypothetical protein
MDGHEFDLLAKELAPLASRRSMFKGLVGALIASRAALNVIPGKAGFALDSNPLTTANPFGNPLVDYWRRAGGEQSWLGRPISEIRGIADGEGIYFQRGSLWRGPASDGEIIASTLHPPLIGRPGLCKPDGVLCQQMIQWGVRPEFPISDRIAKRLQLERPQLPKEVWGDTFSLRPVLAPGNLSDSIPLETSDAVTLPERSDFAFAMAQDVRSSVSTKLGNRTLYDIELVLDGISTVISPHALYAQDEWENFGIIHATDLHVSRRTDLFRKVLRDAGLDESVTAFVNYNNGTRDLIRYANKLHDEGLVDLIIATGDLIDYVYENDDDKTGGGNFEFFMKLITGDVRRPKGEPQPIDGEPQDEPLRVPIYTTLGNHDYRVNPYELYFEVNAVPDCPCLWGFWPPNCCVFNEVTSWADPTREEFGPHNLTADDAEAIQRELLGDSFPRYSPRKALNMVSVAGPKPHESPAYRYYVQNINNAVPDSPIADTIGNGFDGVGHVVGGGGYILALGPHRIVMLDTLWDAGIISGQFDAIWTKLGFGPEDKRTFAEGSPNSEGISEQGLDVLASGLHNGDDGVFIVGMHAPPFNLRGNYYPHFLRESERPQLPPWDMLNYADTYGYSGISTFRPCMPNDVRATGGHVEFFSSNDCFWPMLNEDMAKLFGPVALVEFRDRAPGWSSVLQEPFFWRGKIVEWLRWGIARSYDNDDNSQLETFLQMCLGKGTVAPVNLVLSGHIHKNVEFRLDRDTDGSTLFYTDFYTENPRDEYYPTRKFGSLDQPVRLHVVQDANVNEEIRIPQHEGEPFTLEIPPYPRCVGRR